MPKFTFTSPNGEKFTVNGPDGATQEQAFEILQAQQASSQAATPAGPAAPSNIPMAFNSANKGIAAIPDQLLNTPNRVMNLLKAGAGLAYEGMAPKGSHAPEFLNPSEDPNFVRKGMESLGVIRPDLDPVTKGQQYADMAIQSGVGALASPANGVRQAVTNAAIGGGAGVASQAAGDMGGGTEAQILAGLLAGKAGGSAIQSAQAKQLAMQLQKQQNAPRDKTIADARAAGYVISPSETNPSTINHMLEGIAGKLSTRQLASQRNQDVTNSLARQSIGVGDEIPLSSGLMSQIRQDAYRGGYAPVENFGQVSTGGNYRRALDDISAKYTGAANSFPRAVSDDVGNMVNSLRVRSFDSGDAVKMGQILRDNAAKNYRQGDAAMGGAQRKASNAIENQIEMALSGSGQNGAALLDAFRDSRRQMAKAHTIEEVLNEGTGNVQAKKLGALLRKGAPLSDGLELTGRVSEAFPKNMQSPETMGAVPGISPLDVLGGASMGAMGAAATGSPTGAILGALPAARPLVRSMILSKPYQNLMGDPKYKNSALTQLLAQGSVGNPSATQAMIAQILAADSQDQQ